MGSLKTLLAMLLLMPLPLRAAEDALVSTFATCAGRYSAELEFAWLMQGRQIDAIEDRRAQFLHLLGATVAEDRQRHALGLRINAKMAHAELLTAAASSSDKAKSAWAQRRARSEIAYCRGFLLKS